MSDDFSVPQSTHDGVFVLQQLSGPVWRGWSPRAPRRAAPPRRITRSQKVGGFEGGGREELGLAEILHPSGTLGVLVVTPQVCLQCFIGLKKGGVVSVKVRWRHF